MGNSNDGIGVVRIEGDLDSRTFTAIGERLRAVIAGGCKKLLVDLSACPFVSSSGAGVLIESLCSLEERGGALVLAGLRTEVRDAFTVLGLTQVFAIAESAEAGARVLQTASARVAAG